MNRFINCYWCGKPATGKDHVPPQNLFPTKHRDGLMKVGACKAHNEDFSKLDERLRYHMTLLGDAQLARQHFETKTIRGLKRPEGIGLTIDLATNRFTDYNGKNWQRDESANFDLYFEKIIRGLFYYHFGQHVIGSTSFFSNKMELINMSANAHFYYHLLEEDLSNQWINGNPKNKDIFDYKYYYSESDDRFYTVMTFYKEHKITGVTLPKGKTIDDYGLEYEEYMDRIKK
jgi:hypothetical protein